MLASPDGWTAAALESAKAELRKRGLDDPGEPPPAVPERREDRPDIYKYFGTYPNFDARRLLDAFVREDIDFTLDTGKMGLADIPAVRAAYGGTFGTGVGIAIGVHIDDCAKALEIRQRVLKIMP